MLKLRSELGFPINSNHNVFHYTDYKYGTVPYRIIFSHQKKSIEKQNVVKSHKNKIILWLFDIFDLFLSPRSRFRIRIQKTPESGSRRPLIRIQSGSGAETLTPVPSIRYLPFDAFVKNVDNSIMLFQVFFLLKHCSYPFSVTVFY